MVAGKNMFLALRDSESFYSPNVAKVKMKPEKGHLCPFTLLLLAIIILEVDYSIKDNKYT